MNPAIASRFQSGYHWRGVTDPGLGPTSPHTMRIQGPPIRVAWALLWRAVVLLPFAAVVLLLVFTACFAAVTLPFVGVFYAWTRDWRAAVACVAAWIPSAIIARWAWRRESKTDAEGILL